jgi:hypothetical protein
MMSARSFDLVSSATPRPQQRSIQQQELIAEGYMRDIATGLSYCNHRFWVDRRRALLHRREEYDKCPLI